MSQHTWEIRATRSQTVQVTMDEAEIREFLATRGLDLPDVDGFEPNSYDTVIGAWTDQVYEAIANSPTAVEAILNHPNAETMDEEESLDEVEIGPDTSNEEDAAWRPEGWQATAEETDDRDPVLERAESWTRVATLVPDREPPSEDWWQ